MKSRNYVITTLFLLLGIIPAFSQTSPPNISISTPQEFFEDDGNVTIDITGIDNGDGGTDGITTFSAVIPNQEDINKGLISNLNARYFGGGYGRVTFQTEPDKYGTINIKVTATDNDGSTDVSFDLKILEVNDPPVISGIPSPTTIFELNDQGKSPTSFSFTPSVTDVDNVPADFQFTIQNKPSWMNFNAQTGELSHNNSFPTLSEVQTYNDIIISVNDGSGSGEISLPSFSLTILPVNSAPSFNLSNKIFNITENADEQLVEITSLSVGPNDGGQEFTSLVVTSSNTDLIPNGNLILDPGFAANKTKYDLTFTPAADKTGTAIITVTLKDNGTDNNTFSDQISVTVNASTVNLAPTIDPVDPINISEDAQNPPFIKLSNITSGDDISDVTKVSVQVLNGSLIKNAEILNFDVDAETADLKYGLVENANGNGIGELRVIVEDNGGTLNGGDDTKSIDIIINVSPVNDAPVINGQTDDFGFDEGNTFVVNLSQLDWEDVDGDNVSLNVLTGDNYSISTENNKRIIPNQGFTGLLKINVSLTDVPDEGVAKTSNEYELEVTVRDVNTAPIIDGFKDGYDNSIDEEQRKRISINNFNIIDDAGDTHKFVSVEDGTNYTLPEIRDDYFDIQPVENYFGEINVKVKVKDQLGVESTVSTMLFNVINVNDPPVITGQTSGTFNDVDEDKEIEIIPALLTISDPDRETEFTVIVDNGSNYSVKDGTTVVPAKDFFGELSVPVRVKDGTSGSNNTSNTFQLKIDVLPVNDAPTINKPNDITIDNDNGNPFSVVLSNITRGPNEDDQNITASTIVVSSSDESLIKKDEIEIIYTKNAQQGILNIDPEDDKSGTTTITVKVTDDGGVENGGVDTREVTFDVIIVGKNNKPEIDNIDNIVTFENDKQESIRLKGINDGDEGDQNITVSVSTNRPDLVTNFKVFYTSPDKTGDITYDLVPGANGIAEVTVTVKDDGPADDTGNDNETQEVFEIQIFKRNGAPTIDQVADTTILEDAEEISITLSGISDGDIEEDQKMWIVAESNRLEKIPAPTVTYDSVSSEALLTFTPEADISGEVIINVTVFDDGNDQIGSDNQTTISFKVNILPVNDIPTISPVEGILMQEGKGQQVIPISGITDGDPDLVQTISSVRVTSNKPDFYDELRIAYREGDINGDLIFTPHPDANGFDTLTITVMDNGGVENGGIDSKSIYVPIEIIPLNDAPTITAVPDKDIGKNAGEQIIFLTGITDGDPELDQNIEISATSSNTDVIPDPGNIAYEQGSGEAILKFKPLKDKRSTTPIVITITLKDDGGLPGVDVKEITFKVGVGVVNNAPIITDADGNPLQEEELEYETTKDNPITLCLYATDLDKDVVSFNLTGTEFEGNYGVLDTETLIANGDSLCIDYVPYATTLSGTDEFNVTICDNVQPDQACDTITIRMNVAPSSKIVVYDGISPKNQDNKNDSWFIEGIENFPDNKVQIYSASGMLVYDMPGYNNEDKVWKGESNVGAHLGKTELPTGVYYYVIDFGSNELEPKKGSVVIK
ncbi:tandem-95 repeat protein [Flexithrix dorotheae]|uniref:tandem-95 repeat protein n=1 Tax=Flexithrix dorotheae TaxID=70993 RepID=UPI0003A4098E|nr:tandem-95 repeat protein [Flexithrix dorotheae]